MHRREGMGHQELECAFTVTHVSTEREQTTIRQRLPNSILANFRLENRVRVVLVFVEYLQLYSVSEKQEAFNAGPGTIMDEPC